MISWRTLHVWCVGLSSYMEIKEDKIRQAFEFLLFRELIKYISWSEKSLIFFKAFAGYCVQFDLNQEVEGDLIHDEHIRTWWALSKAVFFTGIRITGTKYKILIISASAYESKIDLNSSQHNLGFVIGLNKSDGTYARVVKLFT